jgi:hypothetical protein
MEAIRNIYAVENHRIVIDLPKSFKHKEVEIIILPSEKSTKLQSNKSSSIDKDEQLRKLLSVNVWNDMDILPIIESQEIINQWKIEEF